MGTTSAPNITTPDRTTRSARIERIRDALLPDGAFESEIAAALGCSTRQVQRLKLPFVKFGMKRVYALSASREALRISLALPPA